MSEFQPFICAICKREIIGHRWDSQHGRDRHIPPICKSCEHGSHGSRAPYAGSGGNVPRIYHGAFMDRRILVQLGAITQELEREAHHINWRNQNARHA